MKVRPLVGHKALCAFHAFNALVLGAKMQPGHLAKSDEEYFESFEGKSDEEKERLIRQAAGFVKLEQDEVEALACFVEDPNGVPYGPQNLKSLPLDQVFEIVVAVSLAIGRMRISLVTTAEKKSSEITPST